MTQQIVGKLPLECRPESYAVAVDRVKQELRDEQESLPEAIAARELYFRVSVVGNCNLSCSFCHNEGAPTVGRLNLDNFEIAAKAAHGAGFRRLQLTGGEPLLRPDIGLFISVGRKYFGDVGVTTNGTLLDRRLDDMVESGVTRVHISLQTESLVDAGDNDIWGIPHWLATALKAANRGDFSLRLNLPVPADMLEQTSRFLDLMMDVKTDLKVFSVLPEGEEREVEYPLEALEALTNQANERRRKAGIYTKVVLRGFRPPTGLRCGSCGDYSRCKEQSHSLRLGSDLKLRPCLASRDWDSHFDVASPDGSITDAALLSLDYWWKN